MESDASKALPNWNRTLPNWNRTLPRRFQNGTMNKTVIYAEYGDKKQCRSSLNVEVIVCKERVVTEGNSVGVNYGDSNGRVTDKSMIPIEATERNDEAGRNDDEGERNGEVERNDEAERNDDEGERNDEAERYIDHGENVGYIELPNEARQQGHEYVEEWEDGLGFRERQEFVANEEVQNLLLRAAFKECYDYDVLNSDSYRYVVRCSAGGCDWYLRVSRPRYKTNDIFTVKTYRKMHSCSRASASTSSTTKKGTPQLVADVIHEEFPGVMDIPSPKLLVDLVLSKAGVKVSYETTLRRKHLAISIIRGSPEDSYKKLTTYLYMLEKRNVGTITSLLLDKDKRFKYVFIALGACTKGFTAMRKVISVDATFMKYGGVLVFAMTQDPNRHHYPIAFGVLDGENDASWDWFFRQLLTVVPVKEDLVFVSDKNASLIKAIAAVYKKAFHGYCVFHLSQNVREKAASGSKEYVGKKFREIAGIYTEMEFDKEYADFRRRFPKVGEYLDKSVTLDKWARCYSKGERTQECTRYYLCFDAIVGKISEWFNKHKVVSGNIPMSHKMVPFVENELHPNCKIGAKLKVTVLNTFLREFSVIDMDGLSYEVDSRSFSCSCKRFDIDKYPCVHAIVAVLVYGKLQERIVDLNIYDLCSDYFKSETWALAYCETIYTVPHECHWTCPDDILSKVSLAPQYPNKRGRYQENMFTHPGERPRKKRRTNNKYVKGRSLGEWIGLPSVG
ncbi:mutator-like transposase [Arabis alpina]|uniref:Mutator-like transposase n=1 Tax=Arabis alpina TaxID=50452 RepID=A0A087G7Y3_ARAAL|nr:mutator-like transposase [Arabis alpina]